MFQRTRDYAKDYEKIGKKVTYKGIYYRFTIEQPKLIQTKIPASSRFWIDIFAIN